MFYIDKGELHLSATARAYPEVQRMEQGLDANLFRQMLIFIRYAHVKRDNEDYWSMPPMERARHVVRMFKLFGITDKHKDKEVDKMVEGFEKNEAVKPMLSLLNRIIKTDKGMLKEDMRRKIEQLRVEYMEERDHDKMQTIYKALTQAMALLEKIDSMDGEEEQHGIEYLFEVPEDIKPHNLKIAI